MSSCLKADNLASILAVDNQSRVDSFRLKQQHLLYLFLPLLLPKSSPTLMDKLYATDIFILL